MFRKRALYEQVGFDRRSASWNTPQEIAAARIDALLTYDAGERLRSIRNPTLLIAAADDLLVPWQLSELVAEEIAHARLVKLDHGGHRFPQTRVEAYNTLLLEFFRTHSVRDAKKVLGPRNPSARVGSVHRIGKRINPSRTHRSGRSAARCSARCA
jgi:hypothetical protein